MTELILYKFIRNYYIEWHREENNGDKDIIAFINLRDMEAFGALLPTSIFDDNGISCVMKDGYIAIWMKEICEYFDIEMENVFIEVED